jgi:hypothetical protein
MTGGRIRGRSFSRGPLSGYDVVRLVYFDESGISNARDEPHVIVAGIIIEADKQYLALEAHLAQLAEDWVPSDKAAEFVAFHAVELFNGGKIFRRPEWIIDKTLPIIRRLLKTPVRFDLPIIYGLCNREGRVRDAPGLKNTKADHLEAAYQWAFLLALIRTNEWMRKNARPEELAMVIVEDNDQMRTALKRVQFWLQYPDRVIPELARHIPLEKIIESILFAKKDESSILQVAEICAYAMKRAAANKSHADWLLGTLVPCIHWGPIVTDDPVRDAVIRLRRGSPFRIMTNAAEAAFPEPS